PVLPLHICERQQSFYAIADMESGSERKAKDGKVTKKSRDTSHKTTPPEGGVLLLLLIPV
ncbi:hypothetical protein, partial [Escherichia coli]|uniref:hypothetical protein n=1 Tax=Escherichia coli TaxID=562 RepID=UPI00164BB56F